MSEINISHQCTGCGVCVTVCPSKCLTMQADQEGFLYPRVNKKNCVNCNLCKQICPVNNCQQTYINVDKKELCIYAVSANDQYVKNASSGGAFPELAQFFLQQGGAVIGVAFNENFEAVLKIIENSNQLPELMQAKYVQATIPEDLYSQALTILNSGRLLLFTGTPCQIAAFKSYCKNKKFSNLLCAEIICHGVPSPAVWQRLTPS